MLERIPRCNYHRLILTAANSNCSFLAVGKILFAGGYSSSSHTRLKEVSVFDPVTKETCRVADLPINPTRGGGVNVVDDNGTIIPLICGGWSGNIHGNCYIYDKSRQKWMTQPGFGEETPKLLVLPC